MKPFPLFQFYPTFRSCPACRSRLLTATRAQASVLEGPLQRMGIPCYCVSCNRRYRAIGRLPYRLVGWMGPLGRRLWWRSASLELTLQTKT